MRYACPADRWFQAFPYTFRRLVIPLPRRTVLRPPDEELVEQLTPLRRVGSELWANPPQQIEDMQRHAGHATEHAALGPAEFRPDVADLPQLALLGQRVLMPIPPVHVTLEVVGV